MIPRVLLCWEKSNSRNRNRPVGKVSRFGAGEGKEFRFRLGGPI